jgi:hypothetical protein
MIVIVGLAVLLVAVGGIIGVLSYVGAAHPLTDVRVQTSGNRVRSSRLWSRLRHPVASTRRDATR